MIRPSTAPPNETVAAALLSLLPNRPVIKSGLRRVWRDADTLQIGLSRRHAVVVHDAGPGATAFLDRLDGTVSREEVAAVASEVGMDPASAHDLLRRLDAHGALDDAAAGSTALRALGTAERDRLAPDLASWALHSNAPGAAGSTHERRRAARVDVHGAGRVGALAAALLTHAGIGELHVLDPDPLRAGDVPAPWARTVPADAAGTTSRADVALDVCEQLAPSVRTGRRRPGASRSGVPAPRPTIALIAPVDSLGTVDLELRDALVRDQVPHLPAYVRETVGAIGPLVIPGRTPCLRCLDLSRTDRDPAWPRVLAQLSPVPGLARRRKRSTPDACDGVLATLVAAQAVLQVLTHLDGGTATATSTSLEIDLTDGLTRCRAWTAHPACGCMWT